ncbi:hypothetical protein KAI11_02405 [Candidatus Bathyarchaeota archaeon]|nr:hypothetical protein [Candidatus Bathyarchaeota archaeon]
MKNMSMHLVLWILLITIIFSSSFVSVAIAQSIGVKEGDWAKYNVEVEVPEELQEYIDDFEVIDWEWSNLEVKSVSDETATLEGTIHYINGTEETTTFEDAREEGFLIEANQGAGYDEFEVPLSGVFRGLYINGTIQRTYANISRDVNYIDVSVTEDITTTTMKAYWDKQTGFLCEMSILMSFEVLEETYDISILLKMTETNMWKIEPIWTQSWFLLIIVIIIVGIVVVFFVLRRR